jgi:hypothetical protein
MRLLPLSQRALSMDSRRNDDDKALVGRHHEAGDAEILVTVH